ncbi:MAG: HAMP domain-containing sensor histidine kinase, partial [bacterium]
LEPSMDGTEEASLIRMIGSASEQLCEIVTEMHEISALNSEKISLQPSRFAFQPLCEEVDVEFQLVIEERRHRLNWNVPEHLFIRVDRAKIKKVMRELIQNAIKFTNDGGEITVHAANAENGEFELTVTDTGIGIPHDERQWIFGLFYEVSDTLHHHSSKSQFGGGGMGIGLAIVNDIVAAHQGRVTVDSEVGRCSRFRVTIPQPGPGSGA